MLRNFSAFSIVYKMNSRRALFGRTTLTLALASTCVFLANCGSFRAANTLNSTAETGATNPSGDTQVYVPASPTPTPIPEVTPIPTPTPRTVASFKVLTYNIKGIPCLRDSAVADIGGFFGVKKCPLANDVWTKNNRERVDNLLANINSLRNSGQEPDVIFLQEAFLAKNDLFDDDAVSSIPARSGYPYFAWGPSAKISNGFSDYWNLINQDQAALHSLLSSGLLILSKHPILNQNMIEYGDLCTIDDCNANKGALHIKIAHPLGFTVDLANTHMQAGTANDGVRSLQANVYASWVKSKLSANYLILGGDFNTRMQLNSAGMTTILLDLAVSHAGQTCSKSSTCAVAAGTPAGHIAGDALDHILYRGLGNGLSLTPLNAWTPDWKFNGGNLSDHLPLYMNLGIVY